MSQLLSSQSQQSMASINIGCFNCVEECRNCKRRFDVQCQFKLEVANLVSHSSKNVKRLCTHIRGWIDLALRPFVRLDKGKRVGEGAHCIASMRITYLFIMRSASSRYGYFSRVMESWTPLQGVRLAMGEVWTFGPAEMSGFRPIGEVDW